MALPLGSVSRFAAGAAGASLLLTPAALAQPVKWDSIPTMQLEGLARTVARYRRRWRGARRGPLSQAFQGYRSFRNARDGAPA